VTSAKTIPLGRREDLKHEWKSSAVLKEGKDKVAREVVAMLNAEGGEIWVGLAEDNGLAVRAEPVADPEGERIRLRDRLTELIDPAPTSQEVEVDTVSVPDSEGGGAILLLTVASGKDRLPFAVKNGEARHYPIRFQDRLRPMDRSEIEAAFRATTTPQSQAKRELRERAVQERREAEARFPGKPALWLLFQPNPPLTQELELTPLRPFLSDPGRSDNLDVYQWESFVVPGWTILQDADRLWSGSEDRWVELRRDGVCQFFSTLRTATRIGDTEIKNELLAYSWLPLILSAARAASALFLSGNLSGGLTVDVAILNSAGLNLHPGNPYSQWSSIWWQMPLGFVGAGSIKEDPVTRSGDFSRKDLAGSPDRCAYPFIRRIYDAAGLDESAIPWWNPTSQRFELKR
jgi:Putative DNA-binding domain